MTPKTLQDLQKTFGYDNAHYESVEYIAEHAINIEPCKLQSVARVFLDSREAFVKLLDKYEINHG
jgi:hypothetical protein